MSLTANKKKNPRLAAAIGIECVVYRGQQINRTLDGLLPDCDVADRGLVAELVNGVVRWFWLLDSYATQLLDRPFKRKDVNVHCILLTGLYQHEFTRVPPHACVNETVNAVKNLGKTWAAPLLNAVMRRFLRDRDRFCEDRNQEDWVRYSHPQWMVEVLKQQWPQHWSKILQANNSKPELSLRVNTRKISVADYLSKLTENDISATADDVSPYGIRLHERVGVEQLEGFAERLVSIQDSSSQLVAPLMDVQPHHRVLDACSSPGGKLSHLLELNPELESVTAIEVDDQRYKALKANMSHAVSKVDFLRVDASRPEDWWDGSPFDRILIDAPCSATGIISKHPDIKHHRRPSDIENLVSTQQSLLEAVLPLLNQNGKVIYTTCSILQEENEHQVANILERHPDLVSEPLPEHLGGSTGHGRQRLQGVDHGEGFYYAAFRRQ